MCRASGNETNASIETGTKKNQEAKAKRAAKWQGWADRMFLTCSWNSHKDGCVVAFSEIYSVTKRLGKAHKAGAKAARVATRAAWKWLTDYEGWYAVVCHLHGCLALPLPAQSATVLVALQHPLAPPPSPLCSLSLSPLEPSPCLVPLVSLL